MPDLLYTLQNNDLGFLQIIAKAWGVDLNAPDADTALPILADAILDPQLINEVVESLPIEARDALRTLFENKGRIPWSQFCRNFGEVRIMGAGRRDRKRPDLDPISPAEVLWYRALIGKAFLNLPPEPQEYAYIPDDLKKHLQNLEINNSHLLGRPASPDEIHHRIPATDNILDQTCTLLAALRMGIDPNHINSNYWDIPISILQALLCAADLVNLNGLLDSKNTQNFLETNRVSALLKLVNAWMNSTSFNELRFLPGLIFEGEWHNNPFQTRETILKMLSELPHETWWNLPTFITAFHEYHPDFQRPAGDYDSWFIRDELTGTYLRGFSSWYEVDGALIRFMITGPLHWLGIFDLAAQDSQSRPDAFRPSRWAKSLLDGSPPSGMATENKRLLINSEAQLILPALTPRSIRYQVARFCQWEGKKKNKYHYRLTPFSLERARKQGLHISHLLNLLQRFKSNPLPPNLKTSLERWERFGTQTQIKNVGLLRVASPDILDKLRHKGAGRFLSETLNSTTAVVKPGKEKRLRDFIAKIGYLTEVKLVNGDEVKLKD